MNLEEKLVRGIESMPMLPSVLVKLLSTSPDRDDYFESIVGLAEGDPGLSLKILKAANSAASAPIKKIESLNSAVLRIGTRQTTSLITSLMMAKVFNPKSADELQIWFHSLQVAVGSRMIVRLSCDKALDAEAAYLAGQFHDIGRLVLHTVDEDHFAVIDEKDFVNGRELLDAEIEVYDGLTHAELGFRVCKHWQLPASLGNIVRHHHLDYHPNLQPTEETKYIAAVALADQISMHLLENGRYEKMAQEEVEALFKRPGLEGFQKLLGVDAEQLMDIIEAIDNDTGRIARVAGLSY